MTAGYRLSVTREQPWWVAQVSGAPEDQRWLVGRATEARTLSRLEETVRDMLGLLLDEREPARFDLVWHYDLPPELAAVVADALEARASFHAAEKALTETGRAAARALTDAGISRRDAATVLGLSFQRVAQLATEAHRDAS
jgi:2-oxo-4-hydroxy-4-carboxy--5-ureidoimidazoline (OHCU) decarboxylase